MKLLKQQAQSGKTVIIVIHDLSLAGRYCDSLWLMDKGKIVCSGSPAKVLTAQNLKDVYQVSAKVVETSPVEVVIPWDIVGDEGSKGNSEGLAEANPNDKSGGSNG